MKRRDFLKMGRMSATKVFASFHEPTRNADTLVRAVATTESAADKSVRVTNGAIRFMAPTRVRFLKFTLLMARCYE